MKAEPGLKQEIKMAEIVKAELKTDKESTPLVQLRHVEGLSVFIEDPEGKRIEIKTTLDGSKIIFTQDEDGRNLAIEEKANGTKLYHISHDTTGLPSSHEIRADKTEIVYFYNAQGSLQHFVELRPNGDRVSTVIAGNRIIYSIEQKQIGGIGFHAWTTFNGELKEGSVWLHPQGEVTTVGDKEIVDDLMKKFSRFLDGVKV